MSSLNDIINKWVEVTEVDPTGTVFYNRNFDLYKYNEKIKSLLEYDGNEVDAVCLIDSFLMKFLKSRSFSLYEIYYGDFKVLSKMEEIKQMKEMIDSYNINEYFNSIVESYKNALKYYEVLSEDALRIVENKEEFLELKVNSLKALEKLEVMQFKKGNFSDNIPKYNKNIYMFRDINILLNSVMNNSIFDGITLNLIYNESNFESSYFCFVIKNGDNVYVLGDIPKYSYPMREEMTRCPGRRMAERVELFNFPYELLDISGDRYGLKLETNTLTVNQDYTVIGTLSDCNSYSIVWLINMFSLLKDKFFDNHTETDKLYYTGAMLDIPGIEKVKTSLIVSNYNSFSIERMTVDKSINKKIKYYHESVGLSSWIVERYKNQINDEIINRLSDKKFESLEMSTAVSVFDKKNIEVIGEIYGTIGTKEDFEYRNAWMNRYNIANAINHLFKKEVEEKKDEIISWFRNAIENNMERILECIAKGELVTTEYQYSKLTDEGERKFYAGEKISYSDENSFNKTCCYKRKNNMLSIRVWNEINSLYSSKQEQLFFQKNKKGLKYGWNYGCYINNKSPIVIASIKLDGPEAIADICGCSVDDLPELLQHYSPIRELSYGNYIIDNLDPMDWVIKNHLSDLNFNVGILLSKSAYNDICKKYGTKPNKIWLN